MNTTTLIIGAAVFLFGVYMTILRYTRPQGLKKQEALKDLFGDKTGNLIHMITYSILPLVAGGIFLLAGVKGVSLF
jgi:hypothetical protein